MSDYDKLLKKQILAFELHKNQSYVDRLMKEGEIKAYLELSKLYTNVIEAKYIQKQEKLKSFKDIETSMKKFNIKIDGPKIDKSIYKLVQKLEQYIEKARADLAVLRATENIFFQLNQDVENSLTTLDILNVLSENKGKYSPDVQARVNVGLCGLKRPGGKKKFNCDNEVVPGTKYCKEHLKQYEPVKYTEIFSEG